MKYINSIITGTGVGTPINVKTNADFHNNSFFDKNGIAWVGTYEGMFTIQNNGSVIKVYNNPDKKLSFGKMCGRAPI